MKNVILCCVSLICSAFFCSLYWVKKMRMEELENNLLTMKNSLLTENMLRQYEHCGVMSDIKLLNGEQTFFLSEVMDEKYKLIVWFSELQCSSCVDFVLKELNSFYDEKLVDKLVVIGSFSSERSYRKFIGDRKMPYPIFGETESILDGTELKENIPIMFLLNKKMEIQSLFYPMKELPYLMNQYLNIINNKL